MVSFFPDGRTVDYKRDDVPELDLAYAITIHKSQGSEFGAVIIPVLTQHFKMLFRNLIYTGLTRAKNLAVFVGTRKALAMAVKNQDTSQRQTFLEKLLRPSIGGLIYPRSLFGCNMGKPSHNRTRYPHDPHLKHHKDSFDFYCLLQRWQGLGYHPTYYNIVLPCDIFNAN